MDPKTGFCVRSSNYKGEGGKVLDFVEEYSPVTHNQTRLVKYADNGKSSYVSEFDPNTSKWTKTVVYEKNGVTIAKVEKPTYNAKGEQTGFRRYLKGGTFEDYDRKTNFIRKGKTPDGEPLAKSKGFLSKLKKN